MTKQLLFISAISFVQFFVLAQSDTFTNPLLLTGPDPWILNEDGYYYYTNTLGDRLKICWADEYSLGMLTANKDADLLSPDSWIRSEKPVFQQAPENNVYATGHNSFFKSPDGTEDWILYHANTGANKGCGWTRSPRAQRFTWNTDGTRILESL